MGAACSAQSESDTAKPAAVADSEQKLVAEGSPLISKQRGLFSFSLLALVGPGILVSLADSDAACLIVAADTGARYGYSALILLQVLLTGVLFLAQELTVRLGMHAKQGHCACIRERFGDTWAWVTFIVLAISCIGATVSELSGIAAVAELWGMPQTTSVLLAAVLLVLLVLVLPYHGVEMVATAFGMCECVFIFGWGISHPDAGELFRGLFTFSTDAKFWELSGANIGAVLMPWMIYFQQSALVAKGLTSVKEEARERTNTLVGSLLTQLIMISVIVMMAATRSTTHATSVDTVADLSDALALSIGKTAGDVLLSCGLLGGAVCAAVVVALSVSWALCEALGNTRTHVLNLSFVEIVNDRLSWAFYGCYIATVLLGAIILLAGADIVALNTVILVADSLLMPVTLCFLWILSSGPSLPVGVRIQGWHKYTAAFLFTLTSLISIGSAIWSWLPQEGGPVGHMAMHMGVGSPARSNVTAVRAHLPMEHGMQG